MPLFNAFSRKIPIYHMTDYNNLEKIVADGGLICKSQLDSNSGNYTDIAQSGIQVRRSRKPVSVCEKGFLTDYVPFYFANRPPMLGSIHMGRVKTYTGTQNDIIYLVSSVQKVVENDIKCFFTDCHAIVGYSTYYDDLSLLENVIDWDIIKSWRWGNPHQEPLRYEKKQAEFLVHRFFPWEYVGCIVTIDRNMKDKVDLIISKSTNSHKPNVQCRRSFYFN